MKLPELQELLDSAADAVPDPARSKLDAVVRQARRRRLAQRGGGALLVAIAILATAALVDVARRPSPTVDIGSISATTTTASAQTSRTTRASTCEGEVAKPVAAAMPPAGKVTRQFFLQKQTAWLDPVGATTPTVTAAAAWEDLSKHMSGGGRARLLLGYYTSIFPYKDGRPEEVHVLAWALFVQHIAIVPMGGPLGPGNERTPQPTCGYGTAYTVLNATTGQQLIYASY